MWRLSTRVERLMKDYPYGCQSEKYSKDIIVVVKLFDLGSSINWWLSEYDPVNKIWFGYVTWFYEDEWGTVSLEELEDLDLPMNIEWIGNVWSIPRVEIDKHFSPTKFPDLPFNKKASN